MILHSTVSNGRHRDSIQWLWHGRAFQIVDANKFFARVAPLYFCPPDPALFLERAAACGFRRIGRRDGSGAERIVFYHEVCRCTCTRAHPSKAVVRSFSYSFDAHRGVATSLFRDSSSSDLGSPSRWSRAGESPTRPTIESGKCSRTSSGVPPSATSWCPIPHCGSTRSSCSIGCRPTSRTPTSLLRPSFISTGVPRRVAKANKGVGIDDRGHSLAHRNAASRCERRKTGR